MRLVRERLWAAMALVAIAGCGAPAPATAPVTTPEKKDVAKLAETVKKLDLEPIKLTDEEVVQCKKIMPPDDWKLVLGQKLCPITGEHLGSMGKPVKVLLRNQVVFLCCGSCVKQAKAEDVETLLKLGREVPE